MALKVLDFETGPEGAALTGNAQGGNSGATQVSAASGGSAVFAKDVVRSGLLGARFTSGTNALAIARFASSAANNTLSVGVVFQHKQTPTLLTGVLSLRHGSGVAGRINWNPDNSLSIVDSGLGNTLTIATGLTPGANYELTVRAKSATTTTGTITAVLYNNAGTEVGRATSSAYNLTANTLAAVDVGIINTNSTAGTVVALDYLQLDDGNGNELRAPAASVAYSGTGATTASASASGAGAATVSGFASTSPEIASMAAGAVSAAGSALTAASVLATGTGAPAVAGQASSNSSTATGAAGVPSASGSGTSDSTVSATGSGAAPSGEAVSVTVTLNSAAIGSATTRGSATSTSSASSAGIGAAGAGGEAATTARVTSAATGLPAFAELVETFATVTVTAGPSTIPHDVDVAVWLLPSRYDAALRPRRYDATTLPTRWKGELR